MNAEIKVVYSLLLWADTTFAYEPTVPNHYCNSFLFVFVATSYLAVVLSSHNAAGIEEGFH